MWLENSKQLSIFENVFFSEKKNEANKKHSIKEQLIIQQLFEWIKQLIKEDPVRRVGEPI